MNPSRPSPRAAGLPSSPRLRSTGETSNRSDVDTRSQPDSPLARRPAPLASISNPRDRPRARPRPPPLQAPEFRGTKVTSTERAYKRPHPQRSPISSSSFASSAGSPFSRTRPGQGYDSLQANIEQDRGASQRASQERTTNERRNIDYGHSRPEAELDDSNGETGPPPGVGYSIWNTVAAAASTLTISVSKAWTGNIATAGGEETPPGQESRLTRAMKAYHLEKARQLSDLPDWLFAEHELRSGSRSRFAIRDEANDEYEETPRSASAPQIPGTRGLRDIYAAAAATSTPAAAGRQTETHADEGVGASKAVDRLRAVRDAKRSALLPNTQNESTHTSVGGSTFDREGTKRAQSLRTNRLRAQRVS